MTVAAREILCLDWSKGETGGLELPERGDRVFAGRMGPLSIRGGCLAGSCCRWFQKRRGCRTPREWSRMLLVGFWSGRPGPSDASVGSRRRVGRGGAAHGSLDSRGAS